MQDIIRKFDLYSEISGADRINAGIEDLRKNIKIEPLPADVIAQKAGKPMAATIAFTLSCEGREPRKLQKVVNYIASLYVDHNTKERDRLAQGTIQFLENQLTNLRSEILAFEKQIAEYKEQHVGELPELMQLNLQTMERLEREINSKEENIKNLVNRKIYLEGQLALLEPTMFKVTADGKRSLTPREELEVLRSQYLTSTGCGRKIMRLKLHRADGTGDAGYVGGHQVPFGSAKDIFGLRANGSNSGQPCSS